MVSTSIGAEELPICDGETILIADNPESFASAILRLLDSPELRERLSRHSRNLLERELGWTTVTCAFLELLEKARANGPKFRSQIQKPLDEITVEP